MHARPQWQTLQQPAGRRQTTVGAGTLVTLCVMHIPHCLQSSGCIEPHAEELLHQHAPLGMHGTTRSVCPTSHCNWALIVHNPAPVADLRLPPASTTHTCRTSTTAPPLRCNIQHTTIAGPTAPPGVAVHRYSHSAASCPKPHAQAQEHHCCSGQPVPGPGRSPPLCRPCKQAADTTV